MRRAFRVAVLCVAAAVAPACTPSSSSSSSLSSPRSVRDDLAKGFINPPQQARPWTWWHWVSGNVSREGITADLEAMKRIGLGGAQMFSVDQGPKGPVAFMSDEWRALASHAISECNRLGLELAIHACEGWSESGGPWITPDLSMQQVVWSERTITGSAKFSEALSQPQTVKDFYRDIAVFAYPTLPGEGTRLAELKPRITSDAGEADAKKLFDGDAKTTIKFAKYLQIELEHPATCSSFTIAPAAKQSKGELQISDDGKEFRTVASFDVGKRDQPRNTMTFDEVTTRFFRIAPAKPDAKKPLAIGEMEMSGPRVRDYRVKSGIESRVLPELPTLEISDDAIIHPDKLIDLTRKLRAGGALEWDVPEGKWTILRIGHTSTGKENAPAMEATRGLECDKMDPQAVKFQFNQFQGRLLDENRALVGKGWHQVLLDSWEARCQNWTPRFREEFVRLRGYDPMPWMAAVTGRFVDSSEKTERFLWDYRRTIADLIAEHHYALFRQLCHVNKLQLTGEAVGIGMPVTADQLQCKGRTDIPMGEFWVNRVDDNGDTKEASSAAHIYGRKVAAAESFTATPENAGWKNDPASLKAQGDLQFTVGINRYVFHRYAHQPGNRKPGVTMGPWGINFERTNTWWEPAYAWIDYISRCQFLLQQGLFVGDICYYYGEDTPKEVRPSALKPPPPAGYDYDACNSEVLLTRMSVREGRIILPDNMSYRVLVLPDSGRMSVAVAKKIRQLVEAGATIVGPRPTQAPGLSDYPNADRQVSDIATQVWGNCDGTTVTSHVFGKGKVFWGEPLEKVLGKAPPDFHAVGVRKSVNIRYIHRRSGDADIYFVSNQSAREEPLECTFRVRGKTPEIWNPLTGQIRPAVVYRTDERTTTVPLRLEPSGSTFVVFRNTARDAHHIVAIKRDGRGIIPASASPARAAGDLKIRKAVYGVLSGKPGQQVDVTAKLRAMVSDGELTVRASNALAGDPAKNIPKELRVSYALNDKERTVVIAENEQLDIPDPAGLPGAMPPAEILADHEGGAALVAWEPGKYEIHRACGEKRMVNVSSIARALEIKGDWRLYFPPGWGAPEYVPLDKLMSWTEFAQDGIKYFSGTARYMVDFEVPEEMSGRDKRIMLDLGALKNLAEVSANSHNIGVLWQPPFRADVTAAVRPGANRLIVNVTNLWPNRLIGDKKLPEEKRYTWSTHDPYNADSPLLPSGLMGPVKLHVGVVTSVAK